jgi:serine/threonine protein kinase
VGTATKDADLLTLAGVTLQAEGGVSYLLGPVIGEGAHGVVCSAQRQDGEGLTPVVVKVLRPRAVRELGALAGPAIAKEVSALRLLSERSPRTPYVVAFLDSGTLRIADSSLALPWVALEYVDGGGEGVTLRARVQHAVSTTQFAFDLRRARNAVKCLTAGLTAIHDVGVIHRDLTPNNVLASGSGADECLKISDFGVARVSSVSTFGDVLLGTPGYCAPEQSFPDKVGIGPYTDVFGLACTVYFLLTGEPYFAARSIPEMLMAVHAPARASLTTARALSPTLRGRVAACADLDHALAGATRAKPEERPRSAAEFAKAVFHALGAE